MRYAFDLKENDKFAILAIRVAFEPKSNVVLSSGIRIYTKWPEGLFDEFWFKNLPERDREEIEQADMIAVVSAKSDKPEILDGEHSALQHKVTSLLLPLMILRARIAWKHHVILGSIDRKEFVTRRFLTINAPRFFDNFPYTPMDDRAMGELGQLHQAIASLDGLQTHQRLFRGLKCLRYMLDHGDVYERMQYAARALDAIAKSEMMRGKTQFKDRCASFLKHKPTAVEFLEKVYQRRSDVVHSNDLTELVEAIPLGEDRQLEIKKSIDEAQLLAEVMVTEVYKRILSTPRLLTAFETDDTMAALWNLPVNERKKLVGPLMDLKAIVDGSKTRLAAHAQLLRI